jgi:hypoxanthine phosphoribosyltransferase
MPEHFRCELVPLDEVYDMSWRLGRMVQESGYRPDVIVAIARGGFVPARFVCDFLGISDMTSLKVQHYAPGAEKEQRAWVKYPVGGDIFGQKVLIVDDVNDTGATLKVALEHLHSLGVSDIRTAVLHEKKNTDLAADYKVIEVGEWHWIIYPWAVVEDVGGFIRKMEPAPATIEEAGRRLAAEYGLYLTEQRLAMILGVSASPEVEQK